MKFYHQYHARAKEKLRKMRRRRGAPTAANQNTKIRNEKEYQLWRWLSRYMGLT